MSSKRIVILGAPLTPKAFNDLEELVAHFLFLLRDGSHSDRIDKLVRRARHEWVSGRPVVATGLPSAILRISVAGSLASLASVWTDVVVVVAEEEVCGIAMKVALGVTGAAGEATTEGPREQDRSGALGEPDRGATRLEVVSWLIPVASGLLAGGVGTGLPSKTLSVFLALPALELR